MKIGYINKDGNYPPTTNTSVHAHQITSRLIKHGCQIYSLEGFTGPLFHKFSRYELLRFLSKIDILYVKATGRIIWDSLSILKIVKGYKIPLIWEVHSPPDFMGKSRFFINGEMRWRMLSGLVNEAICISEEMGKYLKQNIGIRNINVIPNGSDPLMFSPDRKRLNIYPHLNRNNIKILWVGSMGYSWHGVDIIHKIAKRFLNINKNVNFILIGKKSNTKVTCAKNMTIFKEIPYFSIPAYIASSDICLCLYNSQTDHKIGFHFSPLKLFDYMSCAKPIIASAMGQIERVIRNGENGFLTDNSVDDIIKKILFLIDNKDEAEKVGKKAREDVLNYYNWERAAKQVLATLEKALSKKRVLSALSYA